MTVAVLIPCYNEAQTIEKVILDFRKALPDSVIYVYDNNSTDNTAEIARANGAIVRYERNQGKGNVLRRMFREIDADCYILVDGDDTYPADAAPSLVSKIADGYDMVIGDRLTTTYFEENKRPMHNFGNKLMRFAISTIWHRSIKDILTGYRAFSKLFIKSFPVLSTGFEIETEMTIHAVDKNMPYCSVPISYRDRPAGSVSKLNTCSDGFKVIGMLLKLFSVYKPLVFWGLISLFLFLVGVVFGIPVVVEYFETGLVPRFPTLFVSCFVVIASLLTLSMGIILQTIRHTARQEFERDLIKLSMSLSDTHKEV